MVKFSILKRTKQFKNSSIKKKGKETRSVYDKNTEYRLFPLIQYRTSTNIIDYEQFGDIKNNDNKEFNKILPSNLSDITQIDTCPLIRDMPSDYQIEAYIA